MANSFTALGFIKPEVGADTNLWGGHNNSDWDLADVLLQRLVGTTTTRLLQFNVDAVSTTTTRTVTWRDTSGTVALTSDVPPLRSYLAGLTLSTAGSSATFGIAAGVATDSTGVAAMALASAFTKTTSAWAVGTGNGSLDTSTIANSTWYHVYLIQRVDTGLVDVLISLSATAPTMPASYTLSRRIGAMKTNGSAQWTSFIQDGDYFYWVVATTDFSANPLTTPITLNVPTGLSVIWVGGVDAINSGGVAYTVTLYDFGVTTSVKLAYAIATATGTNVTTFTPLQVRTNTSAQIVTSVSGTPGGSTIVRTSGWIDRRGRDA